MNTFPYIILLSGKLFVIELPDKPDPKDHLYKDGEGDMIQDQRTYLPAIRTYESSRSAAIEKAVEIENPEVVTNVFQLEMSNKRVLVEGEEVRWPGTIKVFQACQSDVCTEEGACEHCREPKKLARLIAPEQGRDPQAPERIPSTEGVAIHEPILDAIHSDTYELSELNYPRNHAIDFATWYSGMGRAKVENAYSRYVNEVKS